MEALQIGGEGGDGHGQMNDDPTHNTPTQPF